MKKVLSLILSIVLVLGIFLSVPFTESQLKIMAEAASVSDLTFELNNDGESYSVTACDEKARGALEIPGTYNGKPVTSIGELAFCYCDSLESVTIPAGVTSIEGWAFFWCQSLKSVTIPDSVTSIGDSAFSDCSSLTSITIPDSVTNIGLYAFNCCTSLKKIDVSLNNQCYVSVDGALFNKDKTELIQYPAGKTSSSYTIPDSVTSIGNGAFGICTGLKSVTIGSNVTSIGERAFESCSSLKSLAIPASVTNIGYGAFWSCTGLESITLPDSVTSLGDYAFDGCDSLKSVTIGNGVTSIGHGTFQLCTSLESVTVGNSVSELCRWAFGDCVSLKSLTIPNSMKIIWEYAFENCKGLSDVYYSGSSADWSDISISSRSNSGLMNAQVHYGVKDSVQHLGKGTVMTEVDCTLSGTLTYTCPCGYEVTEDIPALGHNYSTEWIIDTKATCTANGNKYRICAVCGKKETETIPTHNYVGGMCAVCGAQEHYASEHPYGSNSDEEWVIYKEGASAISVTFSKDTATQGDYDNIYIYDGNGNQIRKDSGTILACRTVTVPGDTVKIRLTSDESEQCYGFEITNIMVHGWDEWAIISEPTCTESGVEYRTCSGCEEEESNEIPALGHNCLSEWTVDTQATCTENGSKYRICDNCGERETKAIPATGHTVVIDSSKAPTCTETGLTEGSHCSVCNAVIVAQDIVPATGHTASSWIIDKAATCTVAGSKHKECTVCGKILETQAIPATGHTAVIDSSKAPTCIETGLTEGSHCSVCNSVIVAQSVIPATGHTASDWITDKAAMVNAAGSQHKECTACGAVLETAVIPQLKPSDPTLSKATNANGGVTVTWKAVSGADSYRVYRKTSSSGWSCLNSKVTSTSYTDKTAKSGTTYYYTVRAENEGGLSGYNSTGVSVKYLATPTVTIANAATGVKVSWNKISGASKYYVYRKASGENSWTRLTDSATGTSYTDTKAKSGTTYYYTVKALSGSVASEYKSSSALKYLAQPKVSSLSNENSGITVKWNKITGASGYYVYRKTGSGSWSLIYTVKSGSTVSYTDKSAKAGTTYYYTVRAYSGSVKSTYTSSSAIRRLTTPTLKSVSSAKSGITFKWNKVTGASGYYVYRKTGSGGWQKIDTVKSGSTVSYLDKTAKKGTTYTYTVRAYYSSSISYFNTTGLKIKDKY